MLNTSKLEAQLEPIFVKQLPALPQNAKEIIVKFAPYLAIIGVVLSLPAILAVLGLGTLAAPFAILGGVSTFTSFSLSILLLIVNVVIMIMAIPGLFARTYKAWQLMFISTLIAAVSNLVSFNLGGLILGTALGLYILFQVKSYYK